MVLKLHVHALLLVAWACTLLCTASELRGFVRVTTTCATCPKPADGGGLRVVNASLSLGSNQTLAQCAATCAAAPLCVSFNFVRGEAVAVAVAPPATGECELNQHAQRYAVVPMAGSEYYMREVTSGNERAHQAVPFLLDVPRNGVQLGEGPFKRSMDVSLDYLLRNYPVT